MKRYYFVIIILVFIFYGCKTLNHENVAKGDFFKFYNGQYNPSMPIEEQCILINLTTRNEFLITLINGKQIMDNKIALLSNEITIIQPGKHTITWSYNDPSILTGGSYYTGSGRLIIDFEPGQYYYFIAKRIGSEANVYVENIVQSNYILMQGGIFQFESISNRSIIAGINASIKRDLK